MDQLLHVRPRRCRSPPPLICLLIDHVDTTDVRPDLGPGCLGAGCDGAARVAHESDISAGRHRELQCELETAPKFDPAA